MCACGGGVQLVTPGLSRQYHLLLAQQTACGCGVMQALLQEAAAAGITPRELAVVSLNCLAAWEGQALAGQQQAGLLPQHVSGALQGWIDGHDSRVRPGCDVTAV